MRVKRTGRCTAGVRTQLKHRRARACRPIILGVSDWPGVEDRQAREALLRALANSVGVWQEHGVSCAEGVVPPFASSGEARAIEVLSEAIRTAEQHQALRLILGKCLSGLVHSALVELDGGGDAPTLDLRTGEGGKSLGVALHEEWPAFDPTNELEPPEPLSASPSVAFRGSSARSGVPGAVDVGVRAVSSGLVGAPVARQHAPLRRGSRSSADVKRQPRVLLAPAKALRTEGSRLVYGGGGI